MVTILSLQQKILELERLDRDELYNVEDYLDFKIEKLKARNLQGERDESPNAEILDFHTSKKGE